mgnify:CR=1 FL=1
MKWYKCPVPNVKKGKKWLTSHLVTYPVSYRYNGGIIIKGKWYDGFKVPPPIIPEGFELVGIGVGLEMNCHPPLATVYLRPI